MNTTLDSLSPAAKRPRLSSGGLLGALLGVSCIFALCSCAQKPAGPVVLYGLKGPSSVGMATLFDLSVLDDAPADGAQATASLPAAASPPAAAAPALIRPEILASVDIMTAKFASGEAVAGILPPNVAAKLAKSGVDLQVAAVVGRGMLSILGSDASIDKPTGLAGKTVHVAAPGATPDYVFRRILAANFLEPGKTITLDVSLPTPEIAQALIAGRIDFAVLPEPFASMALKGNPALGKLFDVQEAWARATGVPDYPMTVLAVQRTWARENRSSLLSLIDAYRTSVDWVLANPERAALIAQEAGLGVQAPALVQAIPRSAYCFMTAVEARAELEALYGAFLAFAPASIGGALPAADFYWK